MHKILFYLIGLSFFSPASLLSSPNQNLKKGNDLFINGKYLEAIREYKKVENEAFGGYGLYTNIAKAYALLNDDPKAIIYYEKALKYRPYDTQLKAELSAIYRRNPEVEVRADENVFLKFWKLIYSQLSADTWAILSVFFLLSSAFLVIHKNDLSTLNKRWKPILVSVMILFAFSVLAANSRHIQISNTDQFIVLSPNVSLKSGPDDLSPDIISMPAGTKVIKSDVLGAWIQVSSPYGDIGWVKDKDVAGI